MPTATARKPATHNAARKRTAEAHTGDRVSGEGQHALSVHTYHSPGVPIPYFTPGDVVANVRTTTSQLPVKNIVFYGGLGVLTAAGALEWPVALAVAGATWLVRGKGKPKDAATTSEGPEE